MTSVLNVLREEIGTLEPRLDRLRRAEELLAPLYSQPTQGPPTPHPEQRKPRSRHLTRAQVRSYVIANGPMRCGELVDALGGTSNGMQSHLKRLLVDGEIEADGRPGARQYRGPRASERETPPSRSASRRGVYPVYDAIVDLKRATTEQLIAHTGLTKEQIWNEGRRLLRLQRVRIVGDGTGRAWVPRTDAGNEGTA